MKDLKKVERAVNRMPDVRLPLGWWRGLKEAQRKKKWDRLRSIVQRNKFHQEQMRLLMYVLGD